MISISNEDYKKAKRLLKGLATSKAESLREMEARRQARLLLWKWNKRENCVLTGGNSRDDKLYYSDGNKRK